MRRDVNRSSLYEGITGLGLDRIIHRSALRLVFDETRGGGSESGVDNWPREVEVVGNWGPRASEPDVLTYQKLTKKAVLLDVHEWQIADGEGRVLEQDERVHCAVPVGQNVLIAQNLHVVVVAVLSNEAGTSDGAEDIVDDLLNVVFPLLHDERKLVVSERDERIYQLPQVVCAVVPQGGAVEKLVEVFESVWADQVF